jgi:hypothetical protein
MATLLRVASVLIFLPGSLGFTFDYTKKQQRFTDTEPAKPFVVTYIQYSVGTDGATTVHGSNTKYVIGPSLSKLPLAASDT